MPARVQIVIDAKDAASGILRGLTNNMGAFGGVIQELTAKQINWGNLATQATEMVIDAVKDAVNTTVAYADQIRELSTVSGASAEDTSRFVQVLDDFKIGADDAMAATKALTKQGLTPNIETLAKLSDEYLGLNDAQSKNEFVLKNLGKAGLQWVEVLNQGSAAIKARGAAVSDGLVMDEAALASTRAYEIELDNLNDKIQEVKLSAGKGIIGLISGHDVEVQRRAQELYKLAYGYELNTDKMGRLSQAERDNWAEVRKQAEAEWAAKNSMDAAGSSSKSLTEDLQKQQEAAKALSKAYQDHLSLLGSMQDSENQYEDAAKKNAEERAQLEQQRSDLIKQGYSTASDKVKELDGKLAENSAAAQANADEHDKATKRIILNYLEQQLAADGLTTAEVEFLVQKGAQWGIYTDDVIKQVQEAEREVQAYKDKLNGIPSTIHTVLELRTMYGDDVRLNGAGGDNRRAGGGRVNQGVAYLVGEHGAEMFVPPSNGYIVPNDKLPAMSHGGGTSVSVALSYAPMLSLGNESELRARLIPLVIQGVQEAKAQGRI